MVSYLEIKQYLKRLFGIVAEIDETCDLEISSRSGSPIVISNSMLKDAFDRLQSYGKDKLELFQESYREVALQFWGPPSRILGQDASITDTVNGLSYAVSFASLEYCIFLLICIIENAEGSVARVPLELRNKFRNILMHYDTEGISAEPAKLLSLCLGVYTLKVSSNRIIGINRLRACAASFEFLVMYKKSEAISEYTDINDMYSMGRSRRQYQREDIDTPPQRIYNADVLDYYTLAMESRDPFSMYISFYHVVEHYFDAVFRRKLTDEMRDRITHPDFSYKSEEKLYELAKYVKKHLNSDDDSGKGNEFESLKYVLMEYAPIAELKSRIIALNMTTIDYYQTTKVPFVTTKDTRIPWSDTQGVYTKLATRIYETRNALVHSKSEQAANQYKPYENRKDLLREIALIRAVAELVLVNSSETL